MQLVEDFIMNVGSILNSDGPTDVETGKTPSFGNLKRTSQRNSIVSLLNDESNNGFPEPQQRDIPVKNESFAKTTKQLDNQSKVNAVDSTHQITQEDEISKLNRLKLTKKPKRYSHPPIWAQEWIPNRRNGEILPTNNSNANNYRLSDKSIFNTNSTSSEDLECSITGVIPAPSVTRTIAEWIYANFLEITEQNRPYVELELKFGTIIDKNLNNRLNINVSTECIYTDTSSIRFEAGIHEVGHNEIVRFLEELEKNYQEEAKKLTSKPKRKFNILESDVTDFFYFIRNRNEQSKNVRISKDNRLNPPRYTAISKHRISDLYIHNPSSMYDLRLSLSLENPIANEEIEPTMKKFKPRLTRIKQRNSFIHQQTVTRFDLTRVSTRKEQKNSSTGKKIVDNEKSFEAELEIDIDELFKGFDQVKDGTNAIRFEELVEIFVNNARVLNNRVTKIAK